MALPELTAKLTGNPELAVAANPTLNGLPAIVKAGKAKVVFSYDARPTENVPSAEPTQFGSLTTALIKEEPISVGSDVTSP